MLEGHRGSGLPFVQARHLGLDPVTLSADPTRYDYLADQNFEVIQVDTDNLDALICECSRLLTRYDIAGNTGAEEETCATVGKLCRYFSLPGPDPPSVERCYKQFLKMNSQI